MTAQCPSQACQVTVVTRSADSTRSLGSRLARLLRAGDLVLLSGGLGAGKTTLVQGLGAALDVRGRITSPTFVIARTHPAQGRGPDLIHVDAYRLQSLEEVDALDLDSSMDASVTVVEWGRGRAEVLGDNRLEIEIRLAGAGQAGVAHPGAGERAGRPAREDPAQEAASEEAAGGSGSGTTDSGSGHGEASGLGDLSEVREITVRAVGPRWERVDLAALATQVG